MSLIFLLSNCAESMTLLAPMSGAAGGNVARSAASTAVSYSIHKQTGKTPIEHALNYNDKIKKEKNKKHNTKEKKAVLKNCVDFLEPISENLCSQIKNTILNLSKVKNLN